MKRYVTAFAALAALVSVAASASEIDYQLSYSGAGVNADLIVTTDGILNSSGAYTIEAVSGVRNGVTIDGLLPAGNNPPTLNCGKSTCWDLISDNYFFPSASFVDFYGFTYSVGGGYGAPGGDDINFYYTNGKYYDLTQTANSAHCDGLSSCSYLGTPVTLSVVKVPEPGTLALLAAGLASLGFALARRARFLEACP